MITQEKKSTSVAVIIATYNGEKYIKRQLDSIRSQTYHDFSCYIHDDGSKDRTLEIVKAYIKDDNRFHILNYPTTGGAKNNFLSLLSNTNEDYIFFCDQDDVWETNKIEIMLASIVEISTRNGDIPIAVFSNLTIVDDNLKTIYSDYMLYSGFDTEDLTYKRILISNIAPGCAMVINRKLANAALQFKNINNIDMHDWWCSSIAVLEGILKYISLPLVQYRQHQSHVVGAINNIKRIDRIIRNIRMITNGTIKKKKKLWTTSVYKQIEEIVETQDLEKEIRADLETFLNYRQRPRIERMVHFVRSGWGDKQSLLWSAIWF